MALLGLWEFQMQKKRLPVPGNLEEADDVVKLTAKVMNIKSMERRALGYPSRGTN